MKISNITLIVVFAVLIGIYFAVDSLGGKQKSKSLRTELVEIDSAAVSSLEVESTKGKVLLVKENTSWEVTLNNGTKVDAESAVVKRALEALLSIKPARLATRKKEKWEEYQVTDSTGTRVIVKEGSEKTLDIILGKLGVTGQRSYHTFVRIADEDEVYVVNNFMSFNVPSDINDYRNQTLARVNKDSINSVELTYPGDSSLSLSKAGDYWMANGEPADSAKVVSYIRGLNVIRSQKFVDDANGLSNPLYQSKFVLNDGSQVLIDGFGYNGQLVFQSSENTSSYFADSTILEKVFIGPSEL